MFLADPVRFFILFGVLASITLCRPGLSVTEGNLDLSDYDLTQQTAVLDGEWEFFWQQVPPIDPETKGMPGPVPGMWSGYSNETGKLPVRGFGTYRIRIKIAERDRLYALLVRAVNSSYRIFVDGKELGGAGKPGVDARETVTGFNVAIFPVRPTGDTIEVLIHVANFEDLDGGLRNSIFFGQIETIERKRLLAVATDLFLAGCLLMAALQYLVLFFFRPRERSWALFGLFCLIIFVRVLLEGDRFILVMFPDFPWSIHWRAGMLTFYLATPVFVTFIEKLFPAEFPSVAARASRITAMPFLLAVVFFPPAVFMQTLPWYEGIAAVFGILVIVAIIRAALNRRPGAKLILFGFLVLFGTILFDFLVNHGVIFWSYLSPLGLVCFILIQSSVLSLRFTRTVRLVGVLIRTLMNLIKKHRKNRELLQNARFNSLLERVKPHFLFNALNSILSLLRTSPEKAATAVLRLSGAYRFITKNSERLLVDLNDELGFLNEFLEFERIRFGDMAAISLTVQGDLTGKKIPPLTLQPFVENSLQRSSLYAQANGWVRVRVRGWKDGVFFSVESFGEADHRRELENSDIYKNVAARLKLLYKNVSCSIRNNGRNTVRARFLFYSFHRQGSETTGR